MRFRSPSKQRVWIIQHNILPWRQFSRAIGKLATQKRNLVFFFVLRWGSKHHDVHIKCREFTDIVPDGLKTKRSMTFLLTKDTFSDARCVEDKGNFVLKIKQSKTGSACTHDVVFQTRWSSSKGVMLFSISSGLAAQVEDDCWHESANVALTNFCARHAYVKPTSLSAPRLFGYVSLEVQAHLLELRTLSAHLLSRGCGSW
jgi:hypothetical protein